MSVLLELKQYDEPAIVAMLAKPIMKSKKVTQKFKIRLDI